MRYVAFVLSLLIIHSPGYTQNTDAIAKSDTSIGFLGTRSLYGYLNTNRVIPYGSKLPLYVLINYEHSKDKQFEYFRIDSTKYLMQEYFKSGKYVHSDGIKRKGVLQLSTSIIGKTVYKVETGDGSYLAARYYTALHKTGEWQEYEDSLFPLKYWIGEYEDDHKVGTWKYLVNGNFILETVNHDSNVLVSKGLAYTFPKDSLKSLFIGKWKLQNCESTHQPRMVYYKCSGWSYNNAWCMTSGASYSFDSSGVFYRENGCFNYKSPNRGKWSLVEKGADRYIEIKYTNGELWRLLLIYASKDGTIITERVK